VLLLIASRTILFFKGLATFNHVSVSFLISKWHDENELIFNIFKLIDILLFYSIYNNGKYCILNEYDFFL
jgi:hypothetical protein